MILTIVCSQSTTNEAATGTTGVFHVRMSRSIPVKGKMRLVSVSTVHLQDTTSVPHEKLIIVRIPWMSSSSHMVAGGTNLAITNPDAAAQAFDVRRNSDNGIYIICLEQSNTELTDEIFESSASLIPAAYDITVLSARTGLPYTNLSTLVMKWELDSPTLF